LRKWDTQRIEANARYEGINTLFTNLASLSRSDFRKAIQTAAPDPHLANLMDKMTEAEVRLANLAAVYAEKNPDVVSVRNVIQALEKEIEDRLDGILVGLKARVIAQKAELDALAAAMQAAKAKDIEASTKNAEYWVAK